MKNKKTLLRLSILVVVIAIVLLIVGKQAGWFGKEYAIKVAVETVEKKDITELITANGKIEPQTKVKISPEVPGEIVELHVKEGDKVEKGELLIIIKPDIYRSNLNRTEASLNTQKARLAQAQAQLLEKKLNFDRTRQLFEKQTISRSEFEAVQAAWKVAKAEVEAAKYLVKSAESGVNEARENLQKTKIYAPLSGTVSQLNVELGERVVGTNQFAGTEMLTIADLSRMEVKVEVNENDIVRVSKFDTAKIEIDAYLKREFKGVVTEIASSANILGTSSDQVTNFDVKILLLQSSYSDLLQEDKGRYPFLPGMSATVDIQTETRLDVISVPIQAVTTRTESGKNKNTPAGTIEEQENEQSQIEKKPVEDDLFEVVFVHEADLVHQVKVKTGVQDNNNIEIIEGLESGQEVVVAPYGTISKNLKDSMRVNIVSMEELYKVNK